MKGEVRVPTQRSHRRRLLRSGLAAAAGLSLTRINGAHAQAPPYEVWFQTNDGRAGGFNLLNLSSVADGSGTILIDDVVPNVIPQEAVSLILTVERGWLATPGGGTGCVSLRVMPHGYDLNSGLDRAKTQEWVINSQGVDVIAQDVRMPIPSGHRGFFWALQSTHPTETNKMVIIDLWGYTL